MEQQDAACKKAVTKALSNPATEEATQQALATVQTTMENLLDSLPTLLDDCVPEGKAGTEHEIVSVWGGDPSTHPAIAKRTWEDASSNNTVEPL